MEHNRQADNRRRAEYKRRQARHGLTRKDYVKRTKRRILAGIIAGIVVFFALFFGLFYITEVEVVGNTRYTDREVTDMVLKGFTRHNSLLLSGFHDTINLDDIPFMESVQVEYLKRNKVRLYVTEKQPIGYIRLDGQDYFFNSKGLIFEVLSSEDTDAQKQQAFLEKWNQQVAEEIAQIAETDPNISLPAQDESQSTGAEESAEVQEELTDEGGFHPELVNVPQIEGLQVDPVDIRLDATLDLPNPRILNTILALAKMIDRYDIPPDLVQVTENEELILYYGSVQVYLGTDSVLEEKMTRVAAILPKLSGKSGILHLEDFTEDTVNIIFDYVDWAALEAAATQETASTEASQNTGEILDPTANLESQAGQEIPVE